VAAGGNDSNTEAKEGQARALLVEAMNFCRREDRTVSVRAADARSPRQPARTTEDNRDGIELEERQAMSANTTGGRIWGSRGRTSR
jgi:hypothetical protein